MILIADIQNIVGEHYGLAPGEILTETRQRRIARPRQVGMYLARNLTKKSIPAIGRLFGGRDHTTVCHAISRVSALRLSDAEFDQDVRQISERLSAC